MAASISGSVGRWEKGASNHRSDVETVQKLLEKASKKLNKPAVDPKGVDGSIARPPRQSNTVLAIEAFQSRFMTRPDGIIDVGGRTWRELLAAAGTEEPAPVVGGGTAYFPFSTLPAWLWTESPRSFGSNRSGGKRAHAGCDLYFPKGTWIHAVKGGKVIQGALPFYCETYALVIDHGDFVVRYGEVQRDGAVANGETVEAGQKIAKVGHLVGITVPSDMLHFEMYDKSASGPLTTSTNSKKRADGVSFQRRSDLIDPTPYLNAWQKNLPS